MANEVIGLSLRIYLDDCAYARTLVEMLRGAGHEVQTPIEAGITGMDDAVHFSHAMRNSQVLLTKNPNDFEILHQAQSQHAGIIAIYQDNDPSRDMNYAEIVQAIRNLENAGIDIGNTFHVLNAWRY
ncbi:MAG: DUF5615 family PIN-like protein [Gemmataceae bacterium]|nr:DUF5615 family PIN-like protein [Gemmataceae bacterium]